MSSSSTAVPLEEVIDQLLDTLRRSSTLEICGHLSVMWTMQGPEVAQKSGLSSPLRQTFYLLGLLMTTPEPEVTEEVTNERWQRVISLLNSAVDTYMRNTADAVTLRNVDPKKAHVAGLAFLQHFMSGRLVVAEQLERLVREICSPFDERIRAEVGISATDALEMAVWMKSTLVEQWEQNFAKMRARKDVYAKAIDAFTSGQYNDLDSPEWRAAPEFQAAQAAAVDVYNITLYPNCLEIKTFVERFGQDRTDAFLRVFALRRGGIKGFRYFASPSPPNPAELAPLVILEDRLVCAPMHAMVYNALYDKFDDILRAANDMNQRYLKKRSDYLESRANGLVASLFPNASMVLNKYYETNRAENEHDGLILADRSLIVLEEKSSEMKMPSRDVERSFRNLTDHFKSNRGIQHAYDQANRVLDIVQSSQDPVSFYDERGAVAAVVDPAAADERFAICVTLESFGVLAIDLTLLLDVPVGKQYPWVVNLFDLETLVDAFHKEGLAGTDFLRYLRRRREVQGTVTSDDELNIAGQFIVEGDVTMPASEEYHMVTGYADFFDDLYFEQHGIESGLMADAVPGGVHIDVKASAKAGAPVFVQPKPVASRGPRKVGRNDPCPCGSAKKYKKCCGSML